jgi:hypothetical protein
MSWIGPVTGLISCFVEGQTHSNPAQRRFQRLLALCQETVSFLVDERSDSCT